MELARAVHRAIDRRVPGERGERRRHFRRPLDPADVPPVEDEARLHVLWVVVRACGLVLVERRPHVLRELRAELAGLAREVGPRRRGVGEDERAQPGRLRERVLLREEAAPGLAEHVVAFGDPERLDEVVQLADEEVDRPEVGAAVRVVRAAAVAELVVVDDGPSLAEVGE